MKFPGIEAIKDAVAAEFGWNGKDIETKINITQERVMVDGNPVNAYFTWHEDKIYLSIPNTRAERSGYNYLSLIQKLALLLTHELVHVMQFYNHLHFDEQQANDIACRICENFIPGKLEWPVE